LNWSISTPQNRHLRRAQWGFWEVFGTGLEGAAGGADADAQFPEDDLPRGASGLAQTP